LHDVWLKPRRVFRELAAQPIGAVDYLLGAAQGAVSWLALSRAEGAGATGSVEEILGKACIAGPIAGVVGLYLMAAVYTRLGRRAGGVATRAQVFHVLAYSGVPMVVSLGIWVLTALIVGEATFVETPHPAVEPFVALLLQVQFIAHAILIAWSFLLQVMGFSEVERLATRRAFGIWFLGQLLVALAMLVLAVLIVSLGGGPPAT
jgi:hypothetical protein